MKYIYPLTTHILKCEYTKDQKFEKVKSVMPTRSYITYTVVKLII